MAETPEAGRGVFLKPGYVLNPGDIVTAYPGVVRWCRETNVPALSAYGYLIGPVKVRGSTNKWYAYVDAERFAHGDTHEMSSNLGHLFNTSHPCLPRPYNSPNCAFGVYFKGSRLSEKARPKVSLYIVCTQRVESPVDRVGSVQLLVDYHWLLAFEKGKWCGNTACRPCIRAAFSFFQHLL